MAYSNQSYSSFWMNDDFTFGDYDVLTGEVKKNKGKDLFKLASYKRAISNFVTIVTQQNIPVSYGTKDSYTDGTSIVLSAGMNDKDFDPNVGLALHEASHIKLTDFNLLTQLVGNTSKAFPEIYQACLDGENLDPSKLDIIKDLFNYVEDRRIDLYMFKNAPGYKGYYLSMYDKYFHAKVVDKGLQSNKKRSETWESYMFRIINLTNPNRDLTAHKGLKEVYTAINFKNIGRLKTTQDALDVAFEIFQIVEKYIQKDKKKQGKCQDGKCKGFESKMKTPDGQAKGEENTDGQNGINSDFTPIDGELVPSDNCSDNAKELTDSQVRSLEKAIKKQEEFQKGNIKKSNLAKSDEKKLNAIAESGSELKNVGKDVEKDSYWNEGPKQLKGTNVLVVDKITDSIIESNVYQNIDDGNGYRCYRYVSEDDVKSAIILGKLLGKKLKMRNEERSTVYSRLGNGKIDKRLISALGHGYERVFYNVETDKFNNASIHISIDGSGSMSGDKFKQTAKATIAIATAAKMIQGLDVTVSYRSTEYIGNVDSAAIFILYKSKRDSIKRLYKIMPLLTLNGTTPEGLCFEAIQKLITQGNDNHDSYFINLSDGQPYFGSQGYSYSGTPAKRHTKRQCDTMKANGIKILSYFITSNGTPHSRDISSFKEMYGNDASFVDCNGLAGLAKSLNTLFLTK